MLDRPTTRPRWWASGSARHQLGQQPLDAALDVVPDRSDRVDASTGRVVERPVLVALAGEDRAGVTTAHRDDHIGLPDGLGREDLGAGARDVDALFGHGLHG